MVGNEIFRFCSHCSKNVHNISTITRAEVVNLIEKSNGNLCVRYIKTPNGKLVTAPPKLTQIKRRATIAAGVLATSLTLSALTYAQGEPILPKKNTTQKSDSQNTKSNQLFSNVSGIVKDEFGAVIPGAKITLRDVKTGKIQETFSDVNGFYEFRYIDVAIYEIEIDAPGFEKLILKNVEISKDTKLDKVLIVDKDAVVVGLLIVESSTLITIDDVNRLNVDPIELQEPLPTTEKIKKKKKKN